MVGVAFLSWVWEAGLGEYGEIRGLGTELSPVQIFVPLDHTLPFQALGAIERAGEHNRDVYFGVVPRIHPGGTADDTSLFTRVLWADVDAKMHDHSKRKALSSLLTLSPIPQAIVDSGGGYHAYWKLSNLATMPTAVEIMKGIAAAIGGDHTYDAPRVLRVPGTPNHKYDGWPEARLIRFDQNRLYNQADFDDLVRPAKAPAVVATWAGNPNKRKPLDPWLEELVNSAPPQGSRSEASFKAALWLWRYGYTPEEIEQIFATAPIGEKYREEGKGHRWFSLMLSKFS